MSTPPDGYPPWWVPPLVRTNFDHEYPKIFFRLPPILTQNHILNKITGVRKNFDRPLVENFSNFKKIFENFFKNLKRQVPPPDEYPPLLEKYTENFFGSAEGNFWFFSSGILVQNFLKMRYCLSKRRSDAVLPTKFQIAEKFSIFQNFPYECSEMLKSCFSEGRSSVPFNF